MTGSTRTLSDRFNSLLRSETAGGGMLLGAALIGLAWANSAWRGTYEAIAGTVVGPASLHLDLSLATWAADGLLAIFFFTVGLELKMEFVTGNLRNIRESAVPVLAAVGGMIGPALIFVAVVGLGDRSALHGWAIPTATDIAFALAVLAVFGRGLPRALRTFLLALATVDDLLGITIIATFYTEKVNLLMLAGSLGLVVLFAVVVRSKFSYWWLLLPIAIAAWTMMHASGVHPTVAGVLLGFTVPAKPVHGEQSVRAHRFNNDFAPISSGFVLPVFAFFSAGVNLVDGEGFLEVIAQPIVAGIILGLVVGKFIGVMGTTYILTKLTPLRLPDAIGTRDLLPVGMLTGIGFTVSLLIAELSFPDSEHTAGAKIAILLGTALAATFAAFSLRWDARKARSRDMNVDGIPDQDTRLIGEPKPGTATGATDSATEQDPEPTSA